MIFYLKKYNILTIGGTTNDKILDYNWTEI